MCAIIHSAFSTNCLISCVKLVPIIYIKFLLWASIGNRALYTLYKFEFLDPVKVFYIIGAETRGGGVWNKPPILMEVGVRITLPIS